MAVSDISYSIGIRNTLYNIQANSEAIQSVQQRLATGKFVNSPLDNPTNFFAAANSISRSDIILSRKDGMLEGIQTIKAAENGISSISIMLQAMKGVASAAMSATNQADRDADALTFTEIQKQITAVAQDSGYRGTNLLNGDNLTIALSDGSKNAELPISGLDATADGLGIGYKINAGSGNFVPQHTVTFSGIRPHQANVAFTDSFNLGAVSQTTIDDSSFQLFFNTNGAGADTYMTLSAPPIMQNGTLVVTGTVDKNLPPAPVPLPAPATGNAPFFTQITFGGSLERTFPTYESPANISKVYVDKIEQPGNYVIGNNGDIVFNSPGPAAGQVVKVVLFSSSVKWDSNEAITASMGRVDDALDTVRSFATTLTSSLSIASTRLDFTTGMSNILDEGADNLVKADMDQEGARLLMLNIRQNLGETALGLSSRSQQSILSLF